MSPVSYRTAPPAPRPPSASLDGATTTTALPVPSRNFSSATAGSAKAAPAPTHSIASPAYATVEDAPEKAAWPEKLVAEVSRLAIRLGPPLRWYYHFRILHVRYPMLLRILLERPMRLGRASSRERSFRCTLSERLPMLQSYLPLQRVSITTPYFRYGLTLLYAKSVLTSACTQVSTCFIQRLLYRFQ